MYFPLKQLAAISLQSMKSTIKAIELYNIAYLHVPVTPPVITGYYPANALFMNNILLSL